jgi:hypothetical protein
MIRRTSVAALTACLLLAACGADDPALTGSAGTPGAPEATAPAPAAPPATTAPVPVPPFEADTALDEQAPSGGPLSVTAVRVARQDGYDRVVFELEGRNAGEPGWRVEYVDDPRRDGSGDPVDVEGEATLVVRIDGVGYPFDTGVDKEATAPAVPRDVEVVREVEIGSVFEGVFEGYVGTSRKASFRVFRLADPARVVIDLLHE